MKHIIKKVALLLGIHMSAVTDRTSLIDLIKKLRPIKTNYKLIRIGPQGNGGYLLPDDFEGIEAVFSPGVGSVSSFEDDCAKMGIKVFLADNSVDGPALDNENFHFIKKYVGAITNNDFITIDEWVNSSSIGNNSDLLLQMDIEGFEYEAVYSISNQLMNRFRIIIIEFHELDMLFNKPYFGKISNVFEKILQTHECVHIHPNNCCRVVKKEGIEIPPVMEFTFLRKDRIQTKKYVSEFPHQLDMDSADKETLVLPQCWYEGKNND